MKYFSRALVAAVALVGASLAHSAAITYEGAIPSRATVTGSIGGFGWIREDASGVDFWSFSARGGNRVTLQGARLDPALDPTLDLYFGISAADGSLFETGQSWGGLQFLASADDEVESLVGPFGDPLLSFQVPFTGLYTIAIGGSGSDGEGPYRYNLSVQVVPEPATALLMLAGVVGIGLARRPRAPQ